MEIPLEISYRGVSKTDALEALIRDEVDRLERVYDRVTSCRLSVEQPNEHVDSGSVYRVRVEVRIPSGDIVVRREPGEGDMHDTVTTVVQDVFGRARRALRKQVEQLRRDVKRHPQHEAQAVVVRLFREDGYGFLRALDGHEIYFHRNSVLHDDYDRLEIGTGVRYVEQQGDEGPQASTVQIVDKPGARIKDT